MIKVLLDTNVVLDLFLDRQPFAESAATIWQAHEQKRIVAYTSALTAVNLFYIARKLKGVTIAHQAVNELLNTLNICDLNHKTLRNAQLLAFNDFEDAVQHASAESSFLQAIISRDNHDFTKATLPVFSPVEFIAKYSL